MPKNLPEDRKMKMGDYSCVESSGIITLKWMDTRSVKLC